MGLAEDAAERLAARRTQQLLNTAEKAAVATPPVWGVELAAALTAASEPIRPLYRATGETRKPWYRQTVQRQVRQVAEGWAFSFERLPNLSESAGGHPWAPKAYAALTLAGFYFIAEPIVRGRDWQGLADPTGFLITHTPTIELVAREDAVTVMARLQEGRPATIRD